MAEIAEYIERRRKTTADEIAAANGDYNTLKKMLQNRKLLMKTYREDGAHNTAKVIETVDIELIEAAIAAFY